MKNSRIVRFGLTAALVAGAMAVADHNRWTSVAADVPSFPGFTGGFVVSRSVYPDAASQPALVPGVTILPGSANATAFTGATTASSGTVLSTSGLSAGAAAQITTGGVTYNVNLVTVTKSTLTVTWTPGVLPAPPVAGDRIAAVALAVNDGSYPGVWKNEAPDPAFGVETAIFLDQMTNTGAVTSTLAIDPTQIVTSFSSKSELGLSGVARQRVDHLHGLHRAGRRARLVEREHAGSRGSDEPHRHPRRAARHRERRPQRQPHGDAGQRVQRQQRPRRSARGRQLLPGRQRRRFRQRH